MKKMFKFADQNGRLYYASSPETFARFSVRDGSIKTALFAGEEQVTQKFFQLLQKIKNGIYTKKNK